MLLDKLKSENWLKCCKKAIFQTNFVWCFPSDIFVVLLRPGKLFCLRLREQNILHKQFIPLIVLWLQILFKLLLSKCLTSLWVLNKLCIFTQKNVVLILLIIFLRFSGNHKQKKHILFVCWSFEQHNVKLISRTAHTHAHLDLKSNNFCYCLHLNARVSVWTEYDKRLKNNKSKWYRCIGKYRKVWCSSSSQ